MSPVKGEVVTCYSLSSPPHPHPAGLGCRKARTAPSHPAPRPGACPVECRAISSVQLAPEGLQCQR